MFDSPRARYWLHHLGISPSCAVALPAFFLLCFGLERALPADEFIITTPLTSFYYLAFYAVIIICYAASCELARPRILIHERRYWRRLGFVLLSVTLYFSFCASAGYLKSMIPVFHPFGIDPLLQHIDILLHGGKPPMQWLLIWLPVPVLAGLNSFYLIGWGAVMCAYCIWQLTAAPSEGRTQFLSCFILLWLVGGLAFATLGASVGPIYYANFYHDGYTALNTQLIGQVYNDRTIASALLMDERGLLISLMGNGRLSNINGISAMPSMHTGIAILIAWHSCKYARGLRFLTLPFALVTILGSVALGWHYAVDTYGSALCLIGIWHYTLRELRQEPVLDSPEL